MYSAPHRLYEIFMRYMIMLDIELQKKIPDVSDTVQYSDSGFY